MVWLLGGYMWLFIHRPFEVWPWLGDLQIERAYMILMIVYWAVQPNKGFTSNRLHVALVAFTLVLATAWLASPYLNEPGCTEAVENYLKVVVFYILVVTSVRDEASLKKLLLLYLVAVGLYMSHSLLEYVNGRCQWRMGIRRMVGVDVTYMDPNAFAAGLVCALPLTLPFWAMKPPLWGRAALVGFTGVACVCILLTGSRAGFLGLGVCTLLCLVATGRVKTALALAVLVAALAPVAWFSLPDELKNRYTTIVDPSVGPLNAQVSAEGRWDGLVFGLDAWEKSPLLGHGPGAFKYVTGREGGAHSLYGQVLSEVGALGALALAGLVVCYFLNWRESRRACRDDPARRGDFSTHLTKAIALNVLLLLFLGISGHNLYRYYWVWYAAFQVAAVYCLRRRAAARSAEWAAALDGAGWAPAPEALPHLMRSRHAPFRRAP